MCYINAKALKQSYDKDLEELYRKNNTDCNQKKNMWIALYYF